MSFFAYFTCEYWTKSIPPIANGLMTNIDAAFMKQILYVAKRKWKSDIHQYSQADNLGNNGTGYDFSSENIMRMLRTGQR